MAISTIVETIKRAYTSWRTRPLGTFVRGQTNAALAGVLAFSIFQAASWILHWLYGEGNLAAVGPASFLFVAIEWIKVASAVAAFAIYSYSELRDLAVLLRRGQSMVQQGSEQSPEQT